MNDTVYIIKIDCIQQEFLDKLEQKFTKNNFYRKKLTLPRKGYSNPPYREKIKNLQELLWQDVLLQIKELFEVNSILKIPSTFESRIEEFVLKYYEPNSNLRIQLEIEIPIIIQATLDSHHINLKDRVLLINSFKVEVQERLHTSIETIALKKTEEIIKVANTTNPHHIKFSLIQ